MQEIELTRAETLREIESLVAELESRRRGKRPLPSSVERAYKIALDRQRRRLAQLELEAEEAV